MIVYSIKGCAEINQYDPSLLPPLQCTLQCIGHAQKCITGTLTFRITKLGGWKHTTAFHKIKCPRRIDTKHSNTLDNTDVMEIGW